MMIMWIGSTMMIPTVNRVGHDGTNHDGKGANWIDHEGKGIDEVIVDHEDVDGINHKNTDWYRL